MKKILLVALAAMVAFTFSSCKKDGVYNPKHKIAKVYTGWTSVQTYTDASGSHTETTTVDPFVSQEWNWADKTLESIVNKTRVVNYINNSVSYVDSRTSYTYDDKNRITGMKYDDHAVEFAYNDDKKMSEIKTKDGAELESTVKFAYDGKLLSSIEVTNYYDYKKCEANLAKVLPAQIMRSIELSINSVEAKDVHTSTTTITLEWDGKNVSQTVTKSANRTVTTTYEYDGKLNPFKGMYVAYDDCDFYSKNNVLKASSHVAAENISADYVDEYSYEYDGKYPTLVKYVYVDEYEYFSVKYSTTTTHTTTYEYAE